MEQLPLKQGSPVLLRGHCHQKALVGTGPTKKVPGMVSDVQTVDSGCCGMAGLFRYEKEHYEVSMKMAEWSLFPAVRNSGERTIIAPGTSCREQIGGGTGKQAAHPAQYLADLLG